MENINYQGASAIEVLDMAGSTWVKFYNDSGGALSNGAPKLFLEKWITGIGVILSPVTVATCAIKECMLGIVDNSIHGATTVAASAYGWAQVKGITNGDGVTTSGTVVANTILEINNDIPTAFVDSTLVGGGVPSIGTGAAIAVSTPATNKWVIYLLGRRVLIAAS